MSRDAVSAALLNGMEPQLKEELVEAFKRHPRLEKYFNQCHFLTLYMALEVEGLGELRNRLMDYVASLQEA